MYRVFYVTIILAFTSCFSNDQNTLSDTNDTPFSYEFSKFSHSHRLTSTPIPYHFFQPNHSSNPNETYPLIIALHGAEYFSQPEENFLSAPYNASIGAFAMGWIKENVQSNYPAFVVAPNIHNGIWPMYSNWSNTTSLDLITTLLDQLITQYPRIDTHRIYITGHSMGGDGTWYLGAKLKHRIAALVPMSSALADETTSYITNEINNHAFNLPVWSFIHTQDLGLPSRQLFNEIENLPNDIVFTHLYGNEQHNLNNDQIMEKIESDHRYFYTQYDYPCSIGECHFAMIEAVKEPLLHKWLFKQSLQNR